MGEAGSWATLFSVRNAKRAALGGVLLALAGGCASGPMQPRSGAIAVAPSGTYIDPEIADGYARYKDTLERYGTFYADTVYGVRWCPRDVEPTFAAYQSRGHWAATGLDGKSTVERTHLRRIATSALRHRLRRNPLEETGSAVRIDRAITEVLGL